jgi:hypothetical protein
MTTIAPTKTFSLQASIAPSPEHKMPAPLQTALLPVTYTPPLPGQVQSLTDVRALVAAIAAHSTSSSPERLLVVLYHASYCKICQRANFMYQKLAREWITAPHNTNNTNNTLTLEFVRLEASHVSGPHLRALGLTTFPFVQMLRRGECIAAMSMAPPQSHRRLRETLDMCRHRSAEEWNAWHAQFATEIASHRAAVKELEREYCANHGAVTEVTTSHNIHHNGRTAPRSPQSVSTSIHSLHP